MLQFNGEKGKRTKMIAAIVIIVLVVVMLASTVIGAFFSL